jgi:hypothetical protein
MKPKASRSKTILTKLVAVVILALLVVAAVKCANGASLANTAWSLLPPVIAIVLALITKEAYSALFIGVLVGSLFTCGFAPVATLDTILNDGLIAAISANAGIFLFLVLLGIIVALVNAAGLWPLGRDAHQDARRRAAGDVRARHSDFHRRLL